MRVFWGIVAAATALGMALVFFAYPRKRRIDVPADIAALCAEGSALRESGANISAASKYEAAYARCKATGAPPVVALEVLIHLADTQLDGRQVARAYANYGLALAVLRRLCDTLTPAEAARLDLPRKHAALLTRLSDLAAEGRGADAPDAFGGTHEAARLSREALRVLDSEFAPLARAALAGLFSCGIGLGDATFAGVPAMGRAASGPRLACRLQRHILADYAGVHFNLARLIQQAEGEGSGAASTAEAAPAPRPPHPEALEHAFRAVVLVAAARHSCCQELLAALGGGGGGGAGKEPAANAAAAATPAWRTLADELRRRVGLLGGASHGLEEEACPPYFVTGLCGLRAAAAVKELDALRAAHPLPPGLSRESLRGARGGGGVPAFIVQTLEELLLLDDLSEEASGFWWACVGGTGAVGRDALEAH